MKAYTKPEAEEYRAEVRRRDRARRDAGRMQGHELPVQTTFDERAIKRELSREGGLGVLMVRSKRINLRSLQKSLPRIGILESRGLPRP